MKQKSILLGLVMGLTLASQDTQSLGMGTIQVHSALDQPLHASINLMIGDEEDLTDLTVKLASAADYKRVGLDKSFVPSNITVALDEENPLLIKVASSGAVSEPIVSLLLDVNWANGRIFREFTILLDPPVYSTSQVINEDTMAEVATYEEPEPVEDVVETVESTPEVAVQTRAEAAEEVQETAEEIQEAAMEEEAVVEPVSDYEPSVGSVEVMSGDTLWSIANQNKPSSLTTNQMMAALFNSNPQAFTNNNINQLIKGSRLIIPTADELQSVSQAEALDLVRSHNDNWMPSVSSDDSYSSFQTSEPTYTEPTDTSSGEIDYGVELAGSTDQEDSNGGQEGDGYENLNENATAEELYNKDSENAELKERLSELEDIVEVQQAALEIKSDDLANLEDQFTETGEEVANESDDVWGDDPSVALTEEEIAAEPESMISDVTISETEDTVNEDEQEQVSEVEEQPVASEVSNVSASQAEEESMVDKGVNWVMNNLQWLAIGLLALLALIFVPKFLRSRDKDVAEETSFLDDIKSRKNEKASEDDVPVETDDTKVNEPLSEDQDAEEVVAADDVLADLDKKIDFDNTDEDDDDEDIFKGFDDEPEALVSDTESTSQESDETASDDGFDLDGFLNDDVEEAAEEVSELEDELEAVVDDVEEKAEESMEDTFDVDEDFDFDLSELDELEDANDLDEEGDLSDEIDDALESLSDDAEDAADAIEESVEEAVDEATDFSLDEDFEFDLDGELEELAEEAEDAVEDAKDSAEDAFDEVLDIADDSTESLDVSSDAEIDLGLDLDDMLEDGDVIDTKMDLAKAYLEMGDKDGAKNLLKEVAAEGNDAQIEAAKKLLDDM